jgi:phenylalanyl-tRNA synthetase beta chain
VRRDVAVIVDERTPVEAILCEARRVAPGCVTEVALFDMYRGKGIDSDKKSLAFRILMQDTRRTLTDPEVEAAVSEIINVLQEKFGASLRK